MALTALLIIPLVVAVAFSVDVAAWYAQSTKFQRASDAAALAGVVYMPDTAKAYAVAREVATKNGYTQGVGGFSVTPQGSGNQLQVNIKGPAPVFFGKAGGVQNEVLDRSAVAEYLVSIQMGSPLNYSGNDPDIGVPPAAGGDGTLTNYPQFWLNSASYATYKYNGDRYTAGDCSGSAFGCGAGPPTNSEFRGEGYIYTVDVKANRGPLNIQVYDPAAVNVGDDCKSPRQAVGGNQAVIGDSNPLLNLSGSQMNNNPPVSGGPPQSDVQAVIDQFNALQGNPVGGPVTQNGAKLDVVHRWGRVDAQPSAAEKTKADNYCNGDWVDNFVPPNNPDIKTTYIVRAPDATPLNNLDNPPVCAIVFDAYAKQGKTAPKVLNFNVAQQIMSPATAAAQGYPLGFQGNPNWNNDAASGTEKLAFWKHFHNWATICNIPSPAVGKYIVQVNNNADLTSKGATPQTTAAGGLNIGTLGNTASTPGATRAHNRYTMRAGWASAPPANISSAGGLAWSQDLEVSADNKFPIYTNQSSSDTTFYLARLPPEYKGRKVQLSLWDIGDGAPANLTILPPTESPTAISSCAWDRDGSAMPGSVSFGPATCQANNLDNPNFNGRLTNAVVLLDNNYTCNSASGTGCWFRIRIQTSGAIPNDTTTWSANVLGSPVHLVK